MTARKKTGGLHTTSLSLNGFDMDQKALRSARITSDLILLLAALIWGGGFVAQRTASLHLGFFAFNGLRFLLGGLVMLPFVIHRLKQPPRNLVWIVPAGVLLFSASALQQAGVATTTAGSAGFITGTYVVLVPILLFIFWKQKTKPVTVLAALSAIGGTYLLSTGGTSLAPAAGNIILLCGAVLWALHVIVVGMAVKKVDVFVFSVGQFLLCGSLHLVSSLIFDPPTAAGIRGAWSSILYAGLGSVVIGFTLQAVGQRKAPAADAALILSLEAVFAAIFGTLLLSEHMNLVQILGCSTIFVTIVLAQISEINANRKNELVN
jgi:drug/metabolite transporter (DMT)-like permease